MLQFATNQTRVFFGNTTLPAGSCRSASFIELTTHQHECGITSNHGLHTPQSQTEARKTRAVCFRNRTPRFNIVVGLQHSQYTSFRACQWAVSRFCSITYTLRHNPMWLLSWRRCGAAVGTCTVVAWVGCRCGVRTTGATRPRHTTYDNGMKCVCVVLYARSLDFHQQTALRAQPPSAPTQRTATDSCHRSAPCSSAS